MIERFRHAMLFVIFLGLAACGGGGGGGGSGGGGGGGGGSAEPLADRFVISGNSVGTISVLRVDPIAGFAHAVGFLDASDYSARDLVVDPDNERVVLLTSHTIDTIGFDSATGYGTRATPVASVRT